MKKKIVLLLISILLVNATIGKQDLSSTDRDLNKYYTSIEADGFSKDEYDLFDYEKYNDSIEIIDISDSIAHIKTKKVFLREQLAGLANVSTQSEEVEVVSDTKYYISDDLMEIDIDFVGQDNKVIEELHIVANVTINDDGSVDGEFVYEGVEYNVREVLAIYDTNIIIETFAISTAVIIGLVAGAIIGGVTGAVISYNKYHTIKWRYVVGGAVIGAVFGGATGYGVGLMYGGTVSMTAAVSRIASNPSVLKVTQTVANHIKSRSYINSRLLVSEIIKSVKPVADKYLVNGLRWVSAGTLNGTKGVWELVIDMNTRTIVHFLFRK